MTTDIYRNAAHDAIIRDLLSPINWPLAVTFFPSQQAFEKTEEWLSLKDLAKRIAATYQVEKADLPWLKLATFGDQRTHKNSLRSNANMLAISGIELDYDGGTITPESARGIFSMNDLACLIYTTPSHGLKGNRWRALFPCSNELQCERRAALLARATGLLDDHVDGASFTDSQAFYFGTMRDGQAVKTYLVDGKTCIDLADDLDATAKGKSDRQREPGASSSGQDKTEQHLIDDILTGRNYHGSSMSLLGRWQRQGTSYVECERRIRGIYESIPKAERRPEWAGRVVEIPSWLDYIFGKEARKKSDKREHLEDALGDIADDDGNSDDANEADFGAPIMRGDKLVCNLTNTSLCLYRNRDVMLPAIRHNEMTGRNEWQGGAIDDEVLSLVRARIEQRGLDTISKELTADSVVFVARRFSYHPIRDDLARVAWDGKRRLDTWLVRNAGANDTPYVRAVSRKFLIQMIARVMRPGCKADHTLVLSGPQNQGKSTMLKVLAGKAFFSDNLPAINGSKDTQIHLRGKWLIELAELAPSRKSDAEDLKAFLTSTTDTYRPPYGRIETSWPRQCVFAGTTNDDEFLNDPTGGRRFWPVRVTGVIDTDGLAAERDQLFAEALAAFNADESWWLTREFEAEYAKPVQDAARVSDTWQDAIADWLEKPVQEDFDDAGEQRSRATLGDVLCEALAIQPERQTMAQQKRAAAIMRLLGWKLIHRRGGNLWERPEP